MTLSREPLSGHPKPMRIVCLVDNLCSKERPNLINEFGLSVYIEAGHQRILFDTGAKGAFLKNAERLGIDIAQVTTAVLSHHHSDHGGGLATFLAANRTAKVYLRDYQNGRPYLHLLFLRKDIGLDADLLRANAGRLVHVAADAEVAPGVHLFTRIPRVHPMPRGNRHLWVHGNGAPQRDDFAHELVMAVRAEGQLVAFTGCSHHGVLNMLATVTAAFPGTPITALFGGFHQIDIPLVNTLAGTRDDVAALGRALDALPIGKIYSGHCTGQKAFGILQGVLGAKLEYFATGAEVKL